MIRMWKLCSSLCSDTDGNGWDPGEKRVLAATNFYPQCAASLNDAKRS